MRLLVSLAAVAAISLVPLRAPAVEHAAKTVTYHTSYTQTLPVQAGGQVTGLMRLTFNSGGIVSGTYRDEFAGRILSVAGGLTGSSLWLSIGSRGGHQFRGTVNKDGSITGTLSNWRGPRQYHFTAVPSTS